jgi:hypothetical protein
MSYSLWNVTPCRPLKVNRRRLHLQGRTASYLPHAGFCLGLFFEPENRGDIFFRNVCWHSTEYTSLYSRGGSSSYPPLWEPQILLTYVIRIACSILNTWYSFPFEVWYVVRLYTHDTQFPAGLWLLLHLFVGNARNVRELFSMIAVISLMCIIHYLLNLMGAVSVNARSYVSALLLSRLALSVVYSGRDTSV